MSYISADSIPREWNQQMFKLCLVFFFIWLVVWLPWILFSHVFWEFLIIPIDEVIFFRGVQTPTTNHLPQRIPGSSGLRRCAPFDPPNILGGPRSWVYQSPGESYGGFHRRPESSSFMGLSLTKTIHIVGYPHDYGNLHMFFSMQWQLVVMFDGYGLGFYGYVWYFMILLWVYRVPEFQEKEPNIRKEVQRLKTTVFSMFLYVPFHVFMIDLQVNIAGGTRSELNFTNSSKEHLSIW